MVPVPASTARLVVKRGGHAISGRVPKPTVVVDSREQLPFTFQDYANWIGGTVVAALPTGDYSVVGMESRIALERKSLIDLVLTLTHQRERFLRECERLADIPYRAILIEATWEELKSPYEDGEIQSLAHPNAIVGTLIAIQARWNIPVVTTSRQRPLAEEWAASYLSKVFTLDWLEAQGLGRALQEGDI